MGPGPGGTKQASTRPAEPSGGGKGRASRDSCTGIESNLIYRENNGKTVGADREQDGLNAPKPTITMDELAKHDKPDDLWVAIEGKAYNLTTFKRRHPGGFLPLEGVAGRNATEPFENFHPAPVWKLLKTYHVADIADWKQSEYVKGHREIRQILLERGLFETRPSYYATKALCLGSLLSIAIVLALCCQSAAAHMLGAALIGFFWQCSALVCRPRHRPQHHHAQARSGLRHRRRERGPGGYQHRLVEEVAQHAPRGLQLGRARPGHPAPARDGGLPAGPPGVHVDLPQEGLQAAAARPARPRGGLLPSEKDAECLAVLAVFPPEHLGQFAYFGPT